MGSYFLFCLSAPDRTVSFVPLCHFFVLVFSFIKNHKHVPRCTLVLFFQQLLQHYPPPKDQAAWAGGAGILGTGEDRMEDIVDMEGGDGRGQDPAMEIG